MKEPKGLQGRSRTRHRLANEKDYVKEPKPSGYRGVHLVYRYHSDRSEVYNGLLVELQLRTRLQHAWATAVETVGTFVGQALKSSEGGDEWLRFFELIGSVFALEEATPTGPNTPEDHRVLVREARRAAEVLRARPRLELFGQALRVMQDPSMTGRYFLLVLEPDLESLTVRSYTGRERGAGLADYFVEEKRLAGTPGDTVFVASDSLDSLRRAFPNYFAGICLAGYFSTNTGLKWAWKAEVQSRDEVALARWFRSRIASTANTMPRGGNRTEAPACRRVRW